MNRHYPKSAEEVLESYEWQIKDKLRSLDHLIRQMFRDLQITGQSNKKVNEMKSTFFWDVWNQVAEEEEQKANLKERTKDAGKGIKGIAFPQGDGG